MSSSTARAAATASPPRTSTRCSPPAPAPIVIVTSGCTPEFLQEALAHGVQDVAILPQLTESLVFTLRRAHVLNHNAPRPQAAGPSLTRAGGEGRVITVFSPKGGVGKSTISTGLAGAYCGAAQAQHAADRPRSPVRRRRDHDGHRSDADDRRPRHDHRRARPRQARRLRRPPRLGGGHPGGAAAARRTRSS